VSVLTSLFRKHYAMKMIVKFTGSQTRLDLDSAVIMIKFCATHSSSSFTSFVPAKENESKYFFFVFKRTLFLFGECRQYTDYTDNPRIHCYNLYFGLFCHFVSR